jgi:hypothetical protein
MIKSPEPTPIRSLVWKQPKFAVDAFELRDRSTLTGDERLIGEIYWTSWLADQALARIGNQSWIFNRVGFFRRQILALDQPTRSQVACLEFGWLYEGDIQLMDGQVFHWYRTKAFANAWAVSKVIDSPPLDDQQNKKMKHKKAPRSERLIYEIDYGMHWFKYEAFVTLFTKQSDTPELPLLLCMGLYLVYCATHDAAAAVAASSASVA